MYIALGLMFLGVLAGRITRDFVERIPLSRVIFISILALLFLLGAQIGANDRLFADLPNLGLQALWLTVFCMSGSIAAVRIAKFLVRKKGATRQAKHGQ